MAAPQTKNSSSCSPLPSRPANPRNSEICNPMRRSSSGNPFAKPSILPNQRAGFNPNTPANSPSDHPRRNSIGRGSVVVSFEDKENGKDQKPKLSGVRSPACSKGTKNFMSPTISAASKINASPRKKILGERNESVCTLSDGNEPSNQKKEVSFNPTVTYLEDNEEETLKGYEDVDSAVNSHNIMDGCDSFAESVDAENDLVNLDPSFKISPSSLPSSALAPLDADPLMPPYDPKTNYLSPRPQFLHYKPNPRVELYLKQRDGKNLEEIFDSDDEVIKHETVSDESSLDSVSDEEEELIVSKPNPIATFERAIEARKAAKSRYITRPKFTALLFVLALAGLWASVSNSPITDPSVFNNLNFPNLYVPPEISEFTRENLEGLAQKFRQWFYGWLSYIHDLAIGFREWHKPGRLQFVNSTILLEDSSVDDYLLMEHSKTFEEDQPIKADEFIEEVAEEGFINEKVADDNGEESEYREAIAVLEEASGAVIASEPEEESMVIQTDKATELSDLAAEPTREKVDIAENTTEPIAILNSETEPEVSSPQQSLAENIVSPVETESAMEEFRPESLELGSAATTERELAGSVNVSVRETKDLLSGQDMWIMLTVLSLIAIVPFVFMKNRTSAEPNAAISTDQEPIAKKVDHRHWQEEVETVRESYPSEMSSLLYSSSCTKQERRTTSEAQSREKTSRSNNRRESMASSDCSMGSASYGSFTTYEKVQIKLENGEEEFLTPVRRSSRIRKQVTSP